MNRRFVVAVTLAAVSVFAVETVPAAFAGQIHMPMHAMVRSKLVKFNLRNDSGAEVKIKVGDESMSLAPGKAKAVKLPEGARITVDEATPKRAAGTVLAEVTPALAGNTLVIN